MQHDAFLQVFQENIDSLIPAHDEVNDIINGWCIPQKEYKGARRGAPANQNLVLFIRQDGSYIPVSAALARDYSGLIDRDLPVLGEAGYTITLRFEWPGYPPYNFQLRTYDWHTPPRRITLAALATQVAKIIMLLFEKMEKQDTALEHRQWRIGPNGIQLKDLRLAALEQVSSGSYQSRLFWKP